MHKCYLRFINDVCPRPKLCICCSHCQYHNIDPKCLSQLKISLKKVEVKNIWASQRHTSAFSSDFLNSTRGKDRAPTEGGDAGLSSSGSLSGWRDRQSQALRAGYLHLPYLVSVSCTQKITFIPHHPMQLISHLIYIHTRHSERASKLSARCWVTSLWQAQHSLLHEIHTTTPRGDRCYPSLQRRKPRPTGVDYFVPHFTTVNSRPSSLSKAVDLCLLSPLNPHCSFNKMNQTKTAIGVISVSCKKNFPRASDVKHQNIWKGPDAIASGRLEWSILLFRGEWQLLSWTRLSWS